MTSRLSPLFVAILIALPLDAQRRRPEAERPSAKLEHGTFSTDRFDSEALGRRVPYGIYLPKSYDEKGNQDKRYPLVVWLHGMFEDHKRFERRGGMRILDELVGADGFPETVFVTAEGSMNSFYINGVSSGKWQDCIAVDLVAHLEDEYRIARGRGQRALMGVSMGGYGALKIALRNPGLFGVVAAHSAALLPLDRDQLDERFPWLRKYGGGQRALGKIFGDPFDADKWRAENLLTIAGDLDPREVRGLRVYMDCGDRDRYGFQGPNEELHALLEKRKIPHTWRLVPGGNHGWRSGYNQAALPHSLAFVAASLAAGKGTAGLEGLLGPGGGGPRKERR